MHSRQPQEITSHRAPQGRAVLQGKCACGQPTSGQCRECCKKRHPVGVNLVNSVRVQNLIKVVDETDRAFLEDPVGSQAFWDFAKRSLPFEVFNRLRRMFRSDVTNRAFSRLLKIDPGARRGRGKERMTS